MPFATNFLSRLYITSPAKNIDNEQTNIAPMSPLAEDSLFAETAGALFAPIMASLDRIEQYIDMLPDKPTSATY